LDGIDVGKILVFTPHPDDAEIASGGTLARWASEGREIVLCVVTNGAMGSNDPLVTRADLITTRQLEQEHAASILGIKDVVFLGYEDGAVEDSHDLRRDMIREIRRHKPDIVIGPDPTMYFFVDAYVNHPDHRKVGEAFCAAVSPGAATVPLYRDELYDKGFGPHHLKAALFAMTNNPNYWVDIEEHMETKIKSVSVHYSQTPEFGTEIADRMRMIASASAQGSDYKYAAAFRVVNFRER
jgi:LmbE family N-acetylglucosaminyl deacetylase